MRSFFLFFLLISISSLSFAEGEVVVASSNEHGSMDLYGKVLYAIDSSDAFSFEDILSDNGSVRFTQAEEPSFYYSINAPSQWYKFSVVNRTNKAQSLFFSIDNPLVNEVTFFSSVDSSYHHTGFMFPFDQRQVKHRNLLFKIYLEPNQTGTYALHIASQDRPNDISFTLSSTQYFYDKNQSKYYYNGVLNTFLILLVILLLVLWTSEKERSYLFCLLFIIALVLWRFWRGGIFFQFLWPNHPMVNLFMGRTFYPLVMLTQLLFINQLFHIVRLGDKIKRFFKYTVFYFIGFVLFQGLFKSMQLWAVLIQIGIVASIVLTLIALYHSYKRKQTYYVQYIVAFGIYITVLIVNSFFSYAIRGVGFHDSQPSVLALLAFFAVIGYIFLSKYMRAKGEVVNMNRNLEQLVQKRTFQLNAQKEELRSQHEELLMQKETLQTQREELRAQKELLEIKNVELGKLSLVASKTDNLIYIFTPEGVLDWFNSSFGISLGMTLDEYRRGEPKNIVEVSTNKNVRHVLNTCLREKAVVSYESKHLKENGDSVWYHTTLTPILDEQENIKHLIAIDTDITRLKLYEEELNDQKQSAEIQKNLAIHRKEELESRQVEITDSIRYAKRIQTAIMPRAKQIQRDFADSFVLFLPKDIVSGDFYWYHRIGDKYFIAAVDCTGHGVPGAFMSIIGNYLLNSIIINNGVTDPAEILKQLNRKIKIALKSDNRGQTSDGMDIALAVVDKKNNVLEFASALRPMFLFSDGQFAEIKGDKIPITSSISGTSINNFTTHTFDYNPGDFFYIFSDGIIDQFGGSKGKKFLTKRFKQLLFEINPLSMREQKEIIKKTMDEWKGDYEQVDDVLVMGVRYKERE